MAEISYTKEQQSVIDKRNVNMLVSAAAGSGKTQVLGARILSLITDPEKPMDIDRILIVTFTKAAAAEMRDRIGKMISERLATDPMNQLLIRQQGLLHNSKITTIDSFCLFVVRNNFGDIGVEPGFRIMDDGEGKLLIRDTLDSILERHYLDENDDDFIHLVECYAADTREGQLEDIILKIFQSVTSHPFPEEYLLEQIRLEEDTVTDITESPMGQSVMESVEISLLAMKRKLIKALNICDEPSGPAGSKPCLNEKLEVVERILTARDYEKRRKILSARNFTTKMSSKGADKELYEEAAAINKECKALLDKIEAKYYMDESTKLENDLKYVKRAKNTLLGLVLELYREFSAVKREKNLVDFSDMEHMALNILVAKDEDGIYKPTKTALEYQEYFQTVMVDEYQDSNDVQEYILKSITRGNNYFMVGDVKQSIYKFRQAKPAIFTEKYQSFKSEGIDTRIDLNMNFRSRPAVVDFVNEVFSKVMTKTTADMDYDDAASLKAGASFIMPDSKINDTEVIVVEKQGADSQELDIDDVSKGLEAAMIAERIRNLVDNHMQVQDKKTGVVRDVTYRDFVVLLRATRDWDVAIKDALEKKGIPAFISSKTGYFDAPEIKVVLNLLSVLDNPRNEIALAGVMFSYFGDFTNEDAAAIRAQYPEENLWDALRMAEHESALVHQKCDALVGYINTFRDRTAYMEIRSILESIFYDTGYMDYIRAMKGGQSREANLLMLLERAGDYEKTSYHGLFRFIRYIELLKAREVDYGEAGVLDESSDVVRIMTIHKSKGLEFPVCIVAGMGKQINKRDSKNAVLFDTEYGIALDYVNPETREKHPTIKKTLMARKLVMDSIAEELRVLYVALTRAKEKLIITGTVSDFTKTMEKHASDGSVDEASVLDAVTYFDLLLPGITCGGTSAKYITKFTYDDLVRSEISEVLSGEDTIDMLKSYVPTSDETIRQILEGSFNAIYAHENLSGLYNKTTVSELKKKSAQEDLGRELFPETKKEPKVPKFISPDTKREGTKTGSAFHRMMELIEYKELINHGVERLQDRSFLKEYVQDKREKEHLSKRLSEEYYNLINIDKCTNFLMTDAARRMCVADARGELFKEKSFFLGIDADRVDNAFPKDELIIVQGVIDVCFLEDGEYVLLDYKTDVVNDENELISRYHTQLEYYKEALERIGGRKVKECIIYSASLNKIIFV